MKLLLKKFKYLSFILTVILTSCNDSIEILNGHDFSTGDWLLVNEDDVKGVLKIIDDEKVFSNNPNGIVVNWSNSHEFTTCDGWLRLYRDGELVAKQSYLEKSYLSESPEIADAYKNCSESSINPKNKIEFDRQWDSLKALKNYYPTRYHSLPEDINIIVFFRHD